jgi:hypothetical protein
VFRNARHEILFVMRRKPEPAAAAIHLHGVSRPFMKSETLLIHLTFDMLVRIISIYDLASHLWDRRDKLNEANTLSRSSAVSEYRILVRLRHDH